MEFVGWPSHNCNAKVTSLRLSCSEEFTGTITICISHISLTNAARLEPTCPLMLAVSKLSSLSFELNAHAGGLMPSADEHGSF